MKSILQLTLCDCPGLVMPSFGFSTSEMILNAVLPIHHIKDYFSPIQLLVNRVPRFQLEVLYSILLPRSTEHDEINHFPSTAHEILTTVAFMKGFMSSKGIPDCSRSARLILKDVINGRLKWVASPPDFSQNQFNYWTYSVDSCDKKCDQYGLNLLQQLDKRNLLVSNESTNRKFDSSFFNNNIAGLRIKSMVNSSVFNKISSNKKHGNQNKREKIKRLFSHLDA